MRTVIVSMIVLALAGAAGPAFADSSCMMVKKNPGDVGHCATSDYSNSTDSIVDFMTVKPDLSGLDRMRDAFKEDAEQRERDREAWNRREEVRKREMPTLRSNVLILMKARNLDPTGSLCEPARLENLGWDDLVGCAKWASLDVKEPPRSPEQTQAWLQKKKEADQNAYRAAEASAAAGRERRAIAAAQGSARDQYFRSTEVGHVEALMLLKASAGQGYAPAFLPLAEAFYLQHTLDQSLEWRLRAAEANGPWTSKAMASLALAYYEGRGAPRDYAKAAQWLQRSLPDGDCEGFGNKSFDDHYDCRRMSADLCLRGVLKICPSNLQASIVDTSEQKATIDRYLMARRMRAVWYLEGLGGLKKDTDEALDWLERAEQHGYDLTGQIYANGWGVSANPGKAFKYYRKAAKEDIPEGLFHLGQAYETGLGTDVDLAEARRWYTTAEQRGNYDAFLALQRLDLAQQQLDLAREPQYDDDGNLVSR